ncbi:MAG TPA: polysaccharide biosynthesis/export family protein [Blastocatellia bacterium]|nr:polysaccharide biosynthesis/export family protein [Blastocatellia bacterium]
MNTQLLRVQILSVICLILSLTAYGQSEPQRPRTVAAPKSGSGGAQMDRVNPDVIIYGDEDYKLAPRDVIEVIVEDAPELSVNYTINSNGVIPARFLGATPVAGKTTDEVSKIITDGLRGRYLQDPKVYVSVKQYNSRTFFIQGAVRNPGVYVVSGKPSLFRLLSIAGGLQENHGFIAYVFREVPAKPEKLETGVSQNGANNKAKAIINDAKGNAKGDAKGTAAVVEGEPDYELITANIGGMLKGRLGANLIVQPGDVVYVPPADVFYIAGEVRAPGQFNLRQGITLRQAISLAGGTLFKARLGKGVIFRTDPTTGNFTELPVDIGAVMSGKGKDMPIMGNDVIWIPNSSVKAIGSTVLNTIVPTAVYRFPYPR